MNDFTKDELQIIKKTMKRGLEFITIWQEPAYLDVISKIQSLIDNYCEHENIYHVRSDDGEYSGCDDCGSKW